MKATSMQRRVTIPCMNQSEAFFSYFIRFIRRQSGFSQTEIANLTGFAPSYLSNVENGNAYRNIVKTHKIIYAIGAKPETLHACTARIMKLRRQERLI